MMTRIKHFLVARHEAQYCCDPFPSKLTFIVRSKEHLSYVRTVHLWPIILELIQLQRDFVGYEPITCLINFYYTDMCYFEQHLSCTNSLDLHPWAVYSHATRFDNRRKDWQQEIDLFTSSGFLLGYQTYSSKEISEDDSKTSYSISPWRRPTATTASDTVPTSRDTWKAKFDKEYDIFKQILYFLDSEKYPLYYQQLHPGAIPIPLYGDWLYIELGYRPSSMMKFRKTRIIL